MPIQALTHAWHDFDTAHARLARLPDPPAGGGALFVRIAAVLAEAIDAQAFRQGERLPAAAAIAERFATSADTARAALRHLAAAGYVGKSAGGVYVRGPVRR